MYPEFVQALIEGFTPAEMAKAIDFSTLKKHSGEHITPCFAERSEDVIWSVEIDLGEGYGRQRVFIFILLEFQSTVDLSMAIRIIYYVACFYDQLIKTKQITPGKGLPLIFPIVLYNGSDRWTAKQDIYDMVQPEPPAFLRKYQPHLQYYLVDVARFTPEDLAERKTPLSGVFSFETAVRNPEDVQDAVNRMVDILQSNPDHERMDKVVVRWIKRHLQRLGSQVNVDEIDSLLEGNTMLAENIDQWAERERQKGRQEGRQEGQSQTLLKLIQLKFGTPPSWVEDKLNEADKTQLDQWVAEILTADSLDTLFA